MREGIVAPFERERIERALMGNAAQRQNDAQTRQCADARLQKPATMRDLDWSRLIGRRHTAYGIGDHAVDKRQRLRHGRIVMTPGEPHLEQRSIEQLPGIVAEERSPGTVRSLQAWRQSHDEQLRRLRSKRWHRAVEPVGMRSPVRLAKCTQARTDWTVALGFRLAKGMGDCGFLARLKSR